MRNSSDSDYSLINEIVKIAMVTPVSNAWPEQGASAIKRIKTRLRSVMADDMLRCLLMISMNGPEPGTDAADEFLTRVVQSYEEKRLYKIPSKRSIITPSVEVGIQTENVENENEEDIEIALIQLDQRSTMKYFDSLEDNNMSGDDDDADVDEDFESDGHDSYNEDC